MCESRRGYVPGITNPEWGGDADSWTHAQFGSPKYANVDVQQNKPVGVIYGPDGKTVHKVEVDKFKFGFHPAS